jgi:hypothetical protein
MTEQEKELQEILELFKINAYNNFEVHGTPVPEWYKEQEGEQLTFF